MQLRCCVAIIFGGVVWATAPPDAEILKILQNRVETTKQGVGIVAGVIDRDGRRIVSYGTFAENDSRKVAADSIFEIGSMTKVFTSLLLADMVERGEVALDDPVAKYLPKEVGVPERGGKQITLQDLSMHRSGLPRLPANFLPRVPENPYIDYTAARMYEFLSNYQLTRDIGSQYEYSNLAVGLLGHALAQRAGMSYEALVTSRILKPLGLNSTAITLAAEPGTRRTQGHDSKLNPVSYWDFDVLAGAGALRSDADDILTFLSGFLEYNETPLRQAMKAMLVPRFSGDPEVALAWHILKTKDGEIAWHNGGTGGFRSFMAFDAKESVGIVVLSNTEVEVDSIGLRMLGVLPAPVPAKPRTEITIDPKTLDAYVGLYPMAPGVNLAITKDKDQLFAQLTGQSKYPIFAEGPRDFFYKVVDAQITFEQEGEEKATALTLHQLGRDLRGPRLDTKPRVARTEITINPKLLDGYTGRYQIYNLVMTISRQGDRLFAQLTGEGRLGIFPEGDRDFFFKAMDAQIRFEVKEGHAAALTLREAAGELRFERVD